MRRCMHEVALALERPEKVLAAPRQRARSGAARAAASSAPGGAGTVQRGSSTSTRASSPTLDPRGQVAPDRLDLGQLGHDP